MYQDVIEKIVSNIEKVIIGKTNVIYEIIKGLIAGGHILIEDVPGVGKTMLVKTLARSLDLSYSRIQFTPDLLPSDITGVSIFNQQTRQFEYKKGPIFANIILADEINRTSPKTQSALLEAMEERQVSEGNNTYTLDSPFIVLATQNPVEYEGTYVLPEAQLDRFMMKVKIGYADKTKEAEILDIYSRMEPLNDIRPVAEGEDIYKLQEAVKNVYANREINNYIISIISLTRDSEYITLGASTRAALNLLKVAKASALIDGRDYVVPQDVRRNGVAVLSHRLCLSPSARANSYTGEALIKDIMDRVPMPLVVQND